MQLALLLVLLLSVVAAQPTAPGASSRDAPPSASSHDAPPSAFTHDAPPSAFSHDALPSALLASSEYYTGSAPDGTAAGSAPPSASSGAAPCPDRPPQARYSSKTAYQLVHGSDVTPQDQVEGCEAVYIWQVLRHGTRYPSQKEIKAISTTVMDVQRRLVDNARAGRVPLCPEALDRVLAWRLNATAKQGNMLTEQGQQDMLGIASRMQRRFPRFFRRHADPGNFTFRSTDTQRTLASAKWFGHGLFNAPIPLPPPLEQDPLLKFYAMCPAWDDAVDNNASARAEVTSFQASDVMEAALRRVSLRLGFLEPLSYSEVDRLWEACRYDQAWQPSQSAAWCAPFSQQDLKVFEYRADIKYYYVGGYGNSLDLKLGCPLVKDIVDKLSGYMAGGAGKSGNMYFTHSTAVHMTLARLGIAHDTRPLTSDDYDAMKDNRKWDISQLAPFAANLAVVLYECPAGERYRIRMHLNEKPIPVPVAGCDRAAQLCSWKAFKDNFEEIAKDCSLAFCKRPNSSTSLGQTHTYINIVLVTAVVLVSLI